MSNWDLSNDCYIADMFWGCHNLTTVIGGLNNYGACFEEYQFDDQLPRLALRLDHCGNLTKTSVYNMFSGLYNLTAAGFNRQTIYLNSTLFRMLNNSERSNLFYDKGWYCWEV